MKKAFKIILGIVLGVCLLWLIFVISIQIFFSVALKENDKTAEKYEGKIIKVSDTENLDKWFKIDEDLKSSIITCEAYYTPTSIFFGKVSSYYGSGQLTVTEDYYNKLLNTYDDWELVSKIPPIEFTGYSESEILEFADENFKHFIQNEEFLCSEKMFDSEGCLILLSQERGEMYFFVNNS